MAKKKSDTSQEELQKEDLKELSVSEYFEHVKNMKQKTDSEHVKVMAEVCEQLLKKFEMLGQTTAARKAKQTFDVLCRELELYEKGIDTYVLLDDITKFIKSIPDHTVKVIELENFPREIPDEIVDKWLAVKDLFDQGFIVFTDYTEKTEVTDTVAAAQGKISTVKESNKRKKEKDPVLFGAIKVNRDSNTMRENTYEKMYYVGDWVDQYCDLTFDKLIEKMVETSKSDKNDIVHTISPITTKEEFKEKAGI